MALVLRHSIGNRSIRAGTILRMTILKYSHSSRLSSGLAQRIKTCCSFKVSLYNPQLTGFSPLLLSIVFCIFFCLRLRLPSLRLLAIFPRICFVLPCFISDRVALIIFSVGEMETKPSPKVLVLGHSFARRLAHDLKNDFDPRASETLNLAIRFLCYPGLVIKYGF